jgi:hypothetical protein
MFAIEKFLDQRPHLGLGHDAVAGKTQHAPCKDMTWNTPSI